MRTSAILHMVAGTCILVVCMALIYVLSRLAYVEKLLSVESTGSLYVCLRVQQSPPSIFYCRTWEEFTRQHKMPVDKMRISGR
jgi:hypothetical protein